MTALILSLRLQIAQSRSYLHTCIHTYIHTYINTYTHAYTFIHMLACMSECMYVYVRPERRHCEYIRSLTGSVTPQRRHYR